MTQPLGIDDFFVLEASEYLDRLAVLAGNSVAPNADELVRFTRALRGSALMANQQAIARASSGLEHLVRAFRDGKRTWDHDLTSLTREAVDMLRTLVERVRTWTPDDTARAERLALQLEAAAGPTVRHSGGAPIISDTGVRAFLAREAAALGSVLDQGARSLLAGSAPPETLQAIQRRMQPLRGLAALTDFPPLPDVLDGIERAVVGVSRLEISPTDGGARLESAARALGRAARDIAELGRPDADAPEFRGFAALLLASETAEQPVVPIESLFFAGEDGVVQRGTPARGAPGGGFGAAAVVSRGEHLCQSADELAEATSAAQRDLRLHVLVGDLRTLGAGLPAGLDVSVDAFGISARAAIARGVGVTQGVRFAALLREAGGRLRGYTEVTQPATLTGAFNALIGQLDRLGSETDPVPSPAAPVPAQTVERAPAVVRPLVAVDDESDVVPIEALLLDEPAVEMAPDPTPVAVVAAKQEAEPEPEPVAIESLAPDPVLAPMAEDEWDLAASYGQFEALVRAELSLAATGAASVEAPRVEPEPVVAPAPTSPVPPAPRQTSPGMLLTEADPSPVVDIDVLLYRGRGALKRADELRREIRRIALESDAPVELRPLLDEVLDLVELALAD